ncbi:MAG: aldo/keto reductase [Chloroflexi bacterium]|nr:aldo/keto reductase [Chloroflexota bacterium]MCY3581382.1 aldo/keto reductase [Chloroflexota bacterium]MCY3717527.1 aldo/keto reductase [Chloroflexota bacterium]MDE2651964.1 aldo/keto reductase [Chloroflexota bacterium]MXV93563.1 aldo/keto reductase [Chloroflexota bacterium]
MRYRQLGKTDLRLSELSLGTVALGMPYGWGADGADGTPPPDSESITLIHKAIAQGINFFDTARAYGRSEELLGKALRGRRQSALVATKVSCLGGDGAALPRREMAQQMTQSLHTSLRLLGTDYVDMLLLHSASAELLENSDAIALLKQFQAQGKARAIGASTYGTVAPRIAIAQGIDALQVAFNILDQRLATALFPLAAATGTGIIVRSVFLKGVLSPRADYLPKRLAALQGYSRAVQEAAATLSPGQTREAAALQFVLAHETIATALVGAVNIAELETSLAAARAPRWSNAIVERFRRLRCDQANLLDPSAWGLP